MQAASSTTHYNHVARHPPTACLSMRRCHNKVKANILHIALQYMQLDIRRCRVIDLACGRGGDLGKVQGCLSYTGADLAVHALDELKRRASELRMTDQVTTYHCDASQLPSTSPAHLMLCNFALHYFCDSASHCAQLLDTASQHLKPGGMLCGTYQVHTATEFGTEYHAVVGDCVNALEWRVPWARVVQMAYDCGLALVFVSSFQALCPGGVCEKNVNGFIMQKQAPNPGYGTTPSSSAKPDSHVRGLSS